MKNSIFFILLSCFLFVFKVSAQKPEIKFVDTTIKIDGKFDEAVWESLPEYTDFYNYLPTDIGLAKNQTSIKLFHNGEKLYIRAIYFDTTERTQVSTLKRDVSIAFSDALVMIIDTQNQEQSGYFFAVSSLGNQTDGLVGRTSSGYDLSFSWNSVWEAKTALKGTQKHYRSCNSIKIIEF